MAPVPGRGLHRPGPGARPAHGRLPRARPGDAGRHRLGAPPLAVTIRPAASGADLAAFAALQAVMAEWDVAMSMAEGCPAEAVRAAYYADDIAALQAPGAGLLLAETDGAIVGSAAWWPLEPGIAELGKVFVAEARRGSGIGDRLVGAVLERMRADGYRHVRLETATFMHAAIRLYGRHAFRRRPFFRPPPEGLAALTVAMERAL